MSQRLPTTVAERSQLAYRQMGRLLTERPQEERYKRVSIMWVRWMDAYGMYCPRGWQAAMLRMKELVDEVPNIEYTPTMVLQEVLAPNHDQSASPGGSIADNFSGNDTSDKE